MEERHMQGYLKKKHLRSGVWTPFWVEHDILHGDINYFTENPALGPQVSRLRGHFSLEGATFEAIMSKHGLPKLVIHRKSGVPVKWVAATLDHAEAWVRHLNSTKDIPNTLTQMLSEWKKNKDLTRCIAKNEEEMDSLAKKDFSTAVDFDDDDFDPTLDLPSLAVTDIDGKRVRMDSIIENRITVVFLVRNWGCIMGKYLASKVFAKVDQFEEVGVQLVAIASGTPEAASKWKKECSFPGSVYSDNDNVLVKTFSCKRGYKYLLSPRSLSAVQRALSEGFRPGVVEGEHTFLGGTLVYGKKAGIVFQHLERNLGDHVDVDQIIQAAKRFQRDHPDRSWGPLSYLDLGIFHTQAIASADGMVKPYHFERGDKSVANEDLPRLLDLAYYTRVFQHREHTLWVRKLPEDFDVDLSDDPYGAVVIALMRESNGDWTSLVVSRVGVRRRVVYDFRDLNEKDCIKFLVQAEVVTALSMLPAGSSSSTWGKDPSATAVPKEPPVVKMRKTPVFSSLKTEMIKWEAQERQVGYKFGILLAKSGETTEEEMYNGSNTTTLLFESFLSILGDRVDLAGYNGYSGGLDTKNGRTGTQSLASTIDDSNIMFHVVSMIPATSSEGIIAKKRHIGNDMGVIIFKEGPEPIDVGAFRSQFNHFFIIIRPIPGSDTDPTILPTNTLIPASSLAASGSSLTNSSNSVQGSLNGSTGVSSPVLGATSAVPATPTSTPTLKFTIEVVSKKGVPPAPPFLTENAVFELGPYMRQWLLTKLLNLERMTQETVPIFRGKMEKVRAMAMWEITQVSSGKRAVSDTPAVPAPEPTAPVVVTARRGSVLKKPVGVIELPVRNVGATSPPPTPTGLSSSGSMPLSAIPFALDSGKTKERKGSSPSPVQRTGAETVSSPSPVPKKEKEKDKKDKKEKEKMKRTRSGSMIETESSSRISSRGSAVNSSSSKESLSSLSTFSRPATPEASDSESSAASIPLTSSTPVKPMTKVSSSGAFTTISDRFGSLTASLDGVRPSPRMPESPNSTTSMESPTSPTSPHSTALAPPPISPTENRPISPTKRQLPIPPPTLSQGEAPRTSPRATSPRAVSLNRAATVATGDTVPATNGLASISESGEYISATTGLPRPNRAAPRPTGIPMLSNRSVSLGVMISPLNSPKAAISEQTEDPPASPAGLPTPSRPAPPPRSASPMRQPPPPTPLVSDQQTTPERVRSPDTKKLSRSISSSTTTYSITTTRTSESPGSGKLSTEASSSASRKLDRKSSGYDSDRLAASLARQQELMAEGKAPKVSTVTSETKVAHKAAFNSVKAKWSAIAADAPATSSNPPPTRRLTTAKSLSNLRSVISSPGSSIKK